MYKALVVDDHPLIRAAVKMLLQHEQFEVVAEADNGADAVHMAKEHAPDLIVLDISMPKMDGLTVISRISELRLHSKIVVMTSHPANLYCRRCIKAGASGYVTKTDDLQELIKGVTVVMSGYTYFPDIASGSVRQSDSDATELDLIATLSDRELTILREIAKGMSNKEISEYLLLSAKTISTYKTRLTEKLNIKSVVSLAEYAKRNGLI